jgi:hypothetical protein
MRVLLLWVSLIAGFSAASAHAKPKLDDYPNLHKLLDGTHGLPDLQTTYRIGVKYLRPTQKVVGFDEVEYRAEKMKKRDNSEIREYLEGRVGRVVIGPGRQAYLIDGHHLARALIDADLPEMLINVEADWSNLSENAFWGKMKRTSWVWPEDENGKPISIPLGLPKHISDLVDDPYRSFAWKVKKKGGFEDTDGLFAEFQWGTFFRARFTLRQIKLPSKALMTEALALAHSPEASHLPGFIPARPPQLACRKVLREK